MDFKMARRGGLVVSENLHEGDIIADFEIIVTAKDMVNYYAFAFKWIFTLTKIYGKAEKNFWILPSIEISLWNYFVATLKE